jgi:hypothetical protein
MAEARMAGQPGFFGAEERLRWLSASGDPLERLRAVVDFEAFRAKLEAALPRAGPSRGGRPPWDAVLMFRVLVLQALYTLSDDQIEYQLRGRLSFMRFAGLALEDAVPDAKTVWLYREQLTRAGALAGLFARFDAMLAERGFRAMGGRRLVEGAHAADRPRRPLDHQARPQGQAAPRGHAAPSAPTPPIAASCACLIGSGAGRGAQPMSGSSAEARKRQSRPRRRPQQTSAASTRPVIRGVRSTCRSPWRLAVPTSTLVPRGASGPPLPPLRACGSTTTLARRFYQRFWSTRRKRCTRCPVSTSLM